MTPTSFDIAFLLETSQQYPIATALGKIRKNGEPYPAEAWISALQAAIDEDPTKTATLTALIDRIGNSHGCKQ